MLSDAIDLLREQALLGRGERVSVNATLGRGTNVQVFTERRNIFYNVRISDVSLEREYRGLKSAHSAFPRHVPTPLAWARKDEIDFVVTRGCRWNRVCRVDASLLRFLYLYLSETNRVFREARTEGHRDFLRKVSTVEELHSYASELRQWLDSDKSHYLDHLPYVAQHGDFFLTNLRVWRGRYFVLDWEDFGSVSLPGFDLTIFAVGLLGFNSECVSSVFTEPPNMMVCQIIRYLQEALSLSSLQYRELLKVYSIVFLYLKKRFRYSTFIIRKTEEFIAGLPYLN